MPNRLANATSPYLRQHRDNPVDWYPWGDEAFARARAEDKPVFLSVGYSSCHWCHVMAHESFEDEEVARVLNESFVCVKVDREERPDVDEAYMTAVQLSSGRGGWPMSVFLTPDRKPFFAGTYFPKDDRGQYPGFLSICRQLTAAWRSRRADIEKAAAQYDEALREALTTDAPPAEAAFDEAFVENAIRALATEFDGTNGGFGGAPKFPPHAGLELLMAYALRESASPETREAALGMALYTLERIALGGVRDHVGGGFHRYSTDAEWLLPHFEKMLYDNALLLTNYVRAAAIAHGLDPRMAGVFISAAQGIVQWIEAEMTAPDGTFYSAIDADSEGEEGKFYVWTRAEIEGVLGDAAADFLAAYGVSEEGNFADEATGVRTGANVLHLQEDVGPRFDAELEALYQARSQRVRPGLDDKAVVAWNGMTIGALADAGQVGPAERAAVAILNRRDAEGGLPHQITQGRASGEGFLDDYAWMVDGLIRLASAKSYLASAGREAPGLSPQDLIEEALRLATAMVLRFEDEERGAFYGTSDRHEALFGRTKPVFDQPVPSGNAVALRCLVDLGDGERAVRTLEALLGWMQRAPQATEALYAAALPLVGASPEVEAAPAAAPAPVSTPPADVTVRLAQREIQADASGAGHGVVVLDIPEGVHVNSNEPPARWLTPTRLEFQPLKAKVDYPAATRDRFEGRVEIPFAISLPSGERAAEFEIRVSYQPCTETECLLPQEKVLDGVVLR